MTGSVGAFLFYSLYIGFRIPGRAQKGREMGPYRVFRFSPLTVLLLVAVQAFAFGYGDSEADGTVLPGIHAASVSLVGARAVGFGDAASVFLNPADIYRVPGRVLNVSGGGAVVGELMEDTTGRYTRNYGALANLCVAAKLDLSPGISAAAGLARVSDFTYEGIRYFYEDPFEQDLLTSSESQRSSGGLWEASLGSAYKYGPVILGASGGIRFGSASYTFTTTDYIESTQSDSTWDRDFGTDPCFHLGLMVPFGLSRIGVSYASETDWYADRLAMGGMIYTGSANLGAFGGELELANTSGDTEYTGRVFGQYSPSPSFTFRLGLFVTQRPEMEESEKLGFSLGGSLGLGSVSLDFAYSWSKDERETDIFRNPTNGYYVSDKPSIVSVGLSWTGGRG